MRLRAASLKFWSRCFHLFFGFGPCCRYLPTCSEYGEVAVTRFGFFRGFVLTAKRLLRCHPLALGGWDPVPERENYGG